MNKQFELFDEPRKSWWKRLTASDGNACTLRTYVTLWDKETQGPSEGGGSFAFS